MRARVDMRSAYCVALLLSLIIESKADTISKRQATSCPPNCLQCDGGTCTSCNSGWYGQDCSKSCSSCLGVCSQDSGKCLCLDGTFGPSCGEKCPANCRPDIKGTVTCERAHGFCDNGCKDGYYGDTCGLACGNCSEQTCDRINGYCHNGCTDGWEDPHCSVRCITNCKKCTFIYPSACIECRDGYSRFGQECLRTDRGPSKATIDTIIGIFFGLFVLLILVLVLVYANRQKCTGNSKLKNNDIKALQSEPMYKQDDTGSQISVELI